MFTGAAVIAAAALWSVAAGSGIPPLVNGNAAWVSVSSEAPLSFGTFAGSAPGTIEITPDGSRSAAGVFPIGTDFSAAVFTVTTSDSDQPYAIGLPPFVVLQSPDGSTMRIDRLRSNPAFNGRTTPPSNIGTFTVGGTLHVNPTQSPGTYSGQFDVILNF